MPKVRPLTQSQRNAARWEKQDANFRKQLGTLLGQMGRLRDKDALGELLGLKDRRSVRKVMNDPGLLTKAQERRLMLAFENADLRYDPTLGEGAKPWETKSSS